MKRSYKDVLIRCLILLVGLIIAHFGVTLYLLADLGVDPFNVLIQGLFRTTQSVFSVVRILTDLTFVAVGFLLGGALGVGTMICAFFVGPVAGLFLPYSEIYIDKIVEEGKEGDK